MTQLKSLVCPTHNRLGKQFFTGNNPIYYSLPTVASGLGAQVVSRRATNEYGFARATFALIKRYFLVMRGFYPFFSAQQKGIERLVCN